MSSSLTWLDFSEQEQRRVLGVVELFRERDTVDELGVGVVRDALAELLFPGTSTLHARGRYLLFIPWIYQAIERSPRKCQDAWEHARRAEIALIDALVASDDGEGAIGSIARATLKIFPSTVYWVALGKWGIRTLPFSQNQYHRWLRAGGPRRALADEEGDGELERAASAWHAVPPPPEGFPRGVSFRFALDEARYVAERITMSVPGTLLSHLIEERVDVTPYDYPWELAAALELPAPLPEQLAHAARFSLVIHGAPLLYNLMLAERSQRADADELREDYEPRLAGWAEEVEGWGRQLAAWDRRAFWEQVAAAGTRTPAPTRRFIDGWLDLALAGDPFAIAADERARRLVSERERAVKRGRARLHNPQALALWGGEAGTTRMAFRWLPFVKRIVRDVVAGLEAERA